MTRQRKEIFKEMEQLYVQQQVEYELGHGYFASEIAEAYSPAWDELREKLAATYGKTAREYEMMEYEICEKLCGQGALPYSAAPPVFS